MGGVRAILGLTSLAWLVQGCGGDGGGGSPSPSGPVAVATVDVSPSQSSIAVGGTLQASATARDSKGNQLSGRTISWSTSNAAVASISANGVVSGVAPGSVTIAATSEGVTGTASISVTPAPIAVIQLALPATTVTIGGSMQAVVTLRDAAGNLLTGRSVTWSTSDATIATTTTSGFITAMGLGTVTISATSEGKSATADLQVVPVPLASVTISPAALSLEIGQSGSLTATLRDANGATVTDRLVAWSSSNAAVAGVGQTGRVTAISPGTTIITAASDGRSGSATITVPPGPAARLVIGTVAAGAFDGRPFATQPQIIVTDAWNNRIVNDNATVVNVTVSQGAMLLGTGSRQASGGTITFSGLALTGTIGSNYTLTFATSSLTSAAQTIVLSPFAFGGGTRAVGTEVIPGLYRSNNSQSASCYWERLSGFGGTTSEIIANEIGRGPAVAQIDVRDKGFNSSGCAQWIQVTGGITTSLIAPFSEGVYLVGKDVSAGRWRAPSNNDGCYWERLRGLGGTSADRIANYINDGPAVVDIATTDAGFSSSRCGTWSRVNGPITPSTTSPFAAGTFIVGTDIAPGTWQATTPSTSCYWERLRSFSGAAGDVIGNFYGTTPAIVTIASGDVGFTSSGCGTWSKVP